MATNKLCEAESAGLRSALSACELANQRGIKAELVIVLNGPNAKQLKEQVKEQVASINAKSPSVKILQSNLEQLTAALNFGLDRCSGAWISRFDADDECLEDRLIQINELACSNVDIIAASAIYKNGKDEWLVKPLPLRRVLYLQTPFIHPAVTINTEFLRRIGGYAGFKYAQDYALALSAFDAGARYLIHHKPVIKYNVSEAQAEKYEMSIAMQIGTAVSRLIIKFDSTLFISIVLKIGRIFIRKAFY